MHHVQLDCFFRELLGSFIYNNPINVVLLIKALIYFFRRRTIVKEPTFRLLVWLGLPLILTVLFLSVFNDTLPHWSGPAYTTLILLTALYLSTRPLYLSRRIISYGIGMTGAALIIAIGIINYWPGTLGENSMPDYGRNDITLDMSGWRAFGENFKQLYERDGQFTQSKPSFIFSNYWFPAGHLDFYVARPMGLNVKAVGNLHDIHHFAWLNKRLPELKKGESAYYIAISNFYDPVPEGLAKCFKKISEPVLITQKRSGKIARYFYVYRLMGYEGGK